MSTRSIALENLIEILENGRPLHLVLGESLDRHPEMEKADRAFVSRLTRGVTERKLTLDVIINKLASVKVNKQKPVIRNILRCGIYQIMYMDSVTDFAAVDECVKLAGKRGFRSLGGFCNGVLRNCCRRKEEFADGDMSYKYSTPEWIVSSWTKRFGKERTEAAFKYFFRENGISIRCNISKCKPADLKKNLEAEGVTVIEGLTEKCFRLENCGNPEKLKGFKEGLFTVQDESSVLSGLCAGFKKSDKVLDLCAAPGGKSIHAADYEVEQVVSCDLSSRKTDMIREAVRRCDFKNVEVKENDATVFNKAFEKAYDVVLCDLPCSGLGIIGKKPDIKYNMTEDKMRELADLQKQIIDNAVRYVKPGGTIIYSTCTVDELENEEMVTYFTSKYDINTESLNQYIPEKLWSESTEKGYLQLLPGEYGCDGFFMARLKVK